MKRLLALTLLVATGLQLGGGTGAAQAAEARSPRSAAPTSVTVSVLPVVAGFPFRFRGHTYRTNRLGQAVLPGSAADLGNDVSPQRTAFGLPDGGQAQFARWFRLGTTHPVAALSTYRPVSFAFANLQQQDVPRTTLGEVAVKSSTGYETVLPAGGTSLLLQATRVVSDSAGPAVKQIYYSVQRVEVEGNNVVNRSQTKFFPETERSVAVPLLFFDATVRARDALFGWGVSGTLLLSYPNGTTKQLPLGKGGNVALPGLPRGQYHLSVQGPGLEVVQPVAMSRAQDVDLKVFTWLDVAVVLLVLLVVAVGLVLLGRRFQRRRARRAGAREPAVAPAVQPTAATPVVVLPDAPATPVLPRELRTLQDGRTPIVRDPVADAFLGFDRPGSLLEPTARPVPPARVYGPYPLRELPRVQATSVEIRFTGNLTEAPLVVDLTDRAPTTGPGTAQDEAAEHRA